MKIIVANLENLELAINSGHLGQETRINGWKDK